MNQKDGPVSSLFQPLPLEWNVSLSQLASAQGISEAMAKNAGMPPANGLPGYSLLCRPVLLVDRPVQVIPPAKGRWLVFLHTSDERPLRARRRV
jgi:hypothetical protein